MVLRLALLLNFVFPLFAGEFCEFPKTCSASTNILMRVCEEGTPGVGCHLAWDKDDRVYEWGYTTLEGQLYHLRFNPIQGYRTKIVAIHGDQVCKFNPEMAGTWKEDPDELIEGWGLFAIHTRKWRPKPGPNLDGSGIVYRQYAFDESMPNRVEIHKYGLADDVAFLDNDALVIKQAVFNVTSPYKTVQCEFSGEFEYTYVPMVE